MTAGGEDCADVLLDRAAGIADRPLTYRVPPSLRPVIDVGVRARVPLGSRTTSGFVVSVHPCDPAAERPMREILDIPDPAPLFSASLLALARWVADETLSTLLDAVRCLVPPEIARRPLARPGSPRIAVAVGEGLPKRAGPRQRKILEALLGAPAGLPVAEVVRIGGAASLRRLVALGAARVVGAPRPGPAPAEAADGRDGQGIAPHPSPGPPLLVWGDAQARARWITDAAREVVSHGGQVLVAVPEVGLASGLAGRVADACGGRVVEFHSSLPAPERRVMWRRILAGDVDVVVGTRSALFVPLRRLRLLVVDEEQDPSYKAGAAPRYHGRDVALYRGRLEGARVVLGSPSPSVEAYAGVAEGRMACERLAPRRTPPRLTVVDVRKEREEGRTGALSRPLVAAIRRHLRAGGRVALFVNRVGYARVLLCRECGRAVRCRRCEVSMPYDRDAGTIRCPLCGRTSRAPDVCPHCKGATLRWVGLGTKRVEEVVRRVFPALRIARLDRETAGTFEATLRDFASGRIRLVIGTQLLLRSRRVRPSLVGVIDADAPLYRPDFRATERTLQQLRAVLSLATPAPPGPEAVIQTQVPDHPVIAAVRTGQDERVYEAELLVRRAFGYPPCAHLARLIAVGRDQVSAAAIATRAAQIARGLGVEVLGPAPAGAAARASFRVQCLLRSASRGAVRDAARAALAGAPRSGAGRLVADIDPEEMR